MGGQGTALALAGGDVLRDGVAPNGCWCPMADWVRLFLCMQRKIQVSLGVATCLRPDQSWNVWNQICRRGGGSDSSLDASTSSKRRRAGHGEQVYNLGDPALKFSPRPIGSHAGGGVTKGNPVRTLPTRSCRCNQLTSEELSAVTQ
jgi:hypothetical protein